MNIVEYGKAAIGVIAFAMSSLGTAANATSHSEQASDTLMAKGLALPAMDAANGRRLFASKACVVCHSVNGVGGEDAPMLDAEFMDGPMNPFEFSANMWRGAETMVMMQREELGYVIELSGQELADITAFVHDAKEQAVFSTEDIPEDIQELMEHAETEEEDGDDHD
tara:strand:- start:1559 stop:2059 length:501 start_codon:yes stop_codon:yes gene_type:complete